VYIGDGSGGSGVACQNLSTKMCIIRSGSIWFWLVVCSSMVHKDSARIVSLLMVKITS
jgi:hypothetical protein